MKETVTALTARAGQRHIIHSFRAAWQKQSLRANGCCCFRVGVRIRRIATTTDTIATNVECTFCGTSTLLPDIYTDTGNNPNPNPTQEATDMPTPTIPIDAPTTIPQEVIGADFTPP